MSTLCLRSGKIIQRLCPCKSNPTIGYKGVNNLFQGMNNFQFEVGKTYTIEGEIIPCEWGFHFCEEPVHVLEFYSLNLGNHFLEIEALGEIKKGDFNNSSKACTNIIKIKREIPLEEWLELCTVRTFEDIDKGIKNCIMKYYHQGELHSVNDKPAYTSLTEQRWYQRGKLHRLNGPAIIFYEGTLTKQVWYLDGVVQKMAVGDITTYEKDKISSSWLNYDFSP
jgi:hypothetical protein